MCQPDVTSCGTATQTLKAASGPPGQVCRLRPHGRSKATARGTPNQRSFGAKPPLTVPLRRKYRGCISLAKRRLTIPYLAVFSRCLVLRHKVQTALPLVPIKLLRRIVELYPYRGIFGWATVCVWSFFIAEIMWHLSAFVRQFDFIEIPLIVPYAPLAILIDPRDALLHHGYIFFIAIANWFGIFVMGALCSRRRVSAVVTGGSVIAIVLFAALARMIEFWVIHPPPPTLCY